MSTQQILSRTLVAASAISAFSRIGVDSNGKATVATTDNLDIGTAQSDAASGDLVPVSLYHGTKIMVAAAAITAGSQVYPAAGGQISGSQVGGDIGIAIQAATAALDQIEVAIILQ